MAPHLVQDRVHRDEERVVCAARDGHHEFFFEHRERVGFGDDGGFGGDFHATTDAEFGKGGDNWADGSIMGDPDVGDAQGFEPIKDMKGAPGRFVMALSGQEGENILSYFDERGGKNWAGPEHWRIQRIKKGILYDYEARSDHSN